MVRWLVAAAATAAMLIACQPASAALVTVTYSGLASGYDDGAFGTHRRVYDEMFEVEWRFNFTNDYDGPGAVLGAKVTLSGTEFVVPLSRAGDFVTPYYGRVTTGVFTSVTPVAPNGSFHTYLTLGNAIASPATPGARDVAYSGDGTNVPEMNLVFNSLLIETTDPTFGGAGLHFRTSHVDVAAIDAPLPPGAGGVPARVRGVPEPATWSIMIAGFGLAGSALRRQDPHRHRRTGSQPRTRTIILAVLAAFAMVSSAAAQPRITVRAMGVANGFDNAGVVGDAGTTYANSPFRLLGYFYPDFALSHVVTSNSELYSGGVGWGSASVTIGDDHEIFGRRTSALGVVFDDTSSTFGVTLENRNGALLRLEAIGDAELFTSVAGLTGFFNVCEVATCAGSLTLPGQTDVRFSLTRLSAGREIVFDGIPEPSSWALIILGFGAAGAVLRRRVVVR